MCAHYYSMKFREFVNKLLYYYIFDYGMNLSDILVITLQIPFVYLNVLLSREKFSPLNICVHTAWVKTPSYLLA